MLLFLLFLFGCCAAMNNSTEVAQFLITHKADIEARDKDNRTPLELARLTSRNTKSVVRLLKKNSKQFLNLKLRTDSEVLFHSETFIHSIILTNCSRRRNY